MRRRFTGRLGTESSHILEVANRTVAVAELEEYVSELQPHREIGGRALQDLAEPLRIAAVAALPFELGERVEHPGVWGDVGEDLVCVGQSGRQSIQLRGDERDVGILVVEAPRPLELYLRIGVASGAQIGQPQVGIPERIARRERDDLPKLLLGLGQSPSLQMFEPDLTSRDQRTLIDGLLSASGAADEQHGGERNESFHAILAPPCENIGCFYSRLSC